MNLQTIKLKALNEKEYHLTLFWKYITTINQKAYSFSSTGAMDLDVPTYLADKIENYYDNERNDGSVSPIYCCRVGQCGDMTTFSFSDTLNGILAHESGR